MICQQGDSKVAIKHVPYEQAYGVPFEETRRRVPDVERAAAILGFRAEIPLEEGLAGNNCVVSGERDLMSSSRLSAFCTQIIEAGWIAAVVMVPLYFNVYSSRVFEPDKLTLLRSIAVFMAVAWIIKAIEEISHGKTGALSHLVAHTSGTGITGAGHHLFVRHTDLCHPVHQPVGILSTPSRNLYNAILHCHLFPHSRTRCAHGSNWTG